ncbi:MAG: S41 family peptidase [Gemmatimonadaceae bacterium]
MIWRAHQVLVAATVFAVPSLASAQVVDRAVARQIVERIATSVEQNYLFADTGRMVAEHLRARMRAGAYDTVMEPGRLADRLSADMKATNGDLHLQAVYFAGQSQTPSGPQMVRRRPGDPVPPDQLTQARRANHNVRAADRLAGNVGYISIGELSARSEEAYRVVDAAMAFLERTDAMILDLRRTPGGTPRMSDYVASYFFGPDSVRTLSSYDRAMDQTFERWTRPVPGKQRPDIPVYVLVGPGTASGAEDLAFTFKQSGRGILVGQKTAGAGRLTRIFPVGGGFAASVPGGRTWDPRTGKEWERVGIEPDLASAADDALTVAHAAALARLAATTTDTSWRRSLIWAREAELARANPISVPAATLRQYAGTYDLRVIRFENGKLWYHRTAGRAKEALTPVDDHAFALGEEVRVEFVRSGGRVTGMRVTAPGQASTFLKNP